MHRLKKNLNGINSFNWIKSKKVLSDLRSFWIAWISTLFVNYLTRAKIYEIHLKSTEMLFFSITSFKTPSEWNRNFVSCQDFFWSLHKNVAFNEKCRFKRTFKRKYCSEENIYAKISIRLSLILKLRVIFLHIQDSRINLVITLDICFTRLWKCLKFFYKIYILPILYKILKETNKENVAY